MLSSVSYEMSIGVAHDSSFMTATLRLFDIDADRSRWMGVLVYWRCCIFVVFSVIISSGCISIVIPSRATETRVLFIVCAASNNSKWPRIAGLYCTSCVAQVYYLVRFVLRLRHLISRKSLHKWVRFYTKYRTFLRVDQGNVGEWRPTG
jgi:hypothetical protein